jgi:hypothetical protein
MLVLTPALRVAETADDSRTDGVETTDADDQDDQAHVEHAIHDAVQEALDEAVAEAAEDELRGSQEARADMPEASAEEEADINAAEEPDDNLQDRIAELEAAVAARQDQWEPDGEGDGDYAATPVEAMTWEDDDHDQEEPVARDWQNADDAELIEAEVEVEAEEDEPRKTVADTVEDMASLHAEDVASAEDLSTDDSWGDPDEADLDDAGLDLLATEDSILDEDALREMVAEIVRQELQGSLGERITRNVRKLVRREIHRALAAQELD